MSKSVLLTDEEMEEIRKLRLWHWKSAMAARQSAEYHKMYAGYSPISTVVTSFERQANIHIKAVQTLNALFPLGDTAEMDHQKEGL